MPNFFDNFNVLLEVLKYIVQVEHFAELKLGKVVTADFCPTLRVFVLRSAIYVAILA